MPFFWSPSAGIVSITFAKAYVDKSARASMLDAAAFPTHFVPSPFIVAWTLPYNAFFTGSVSTCSTPNGTSASSRLARSASASLSSSSLAASLSFLAYFTELRAAVALYQKSTSSLAQHLSSLSSLSPLLSSSRSSSSVI